MADDTSSIRPSERDVLETKIETVRAGLAVLMNRIEKIELREQQLDTVRLESVERYVNAIMKRQNHQDERWREVDNRLYELGDQVRLLGDRLDRIERRLDRAGIAVE